ncbi:tyrosine-type recombinase/integrase [Chloroflexota bacterium]
MILNHARLPIPTLPPEADLASKEQPIKVNLFTEKLTKKLTNSILSDFLVSRRQGLSTHTLIFYQRCLNKAIGIELTPEGINEFLSSLTCGNGKFAYYRAIRVLCNWLHRQGQFENNPINLVDSPHLAKKLLPAITEEQVLLLLNSTDNLRDRCIVSLLFDSGLRLSEVCAIKSRNINWSINTLSVLVKGNREAKAAFSPNTALSLREYIAKSRHSSDSIFDMKPRGVQDMLSRLSGKVGFPCNAHSFRRGFACNLHKKGLSTLSIMHLGRWSSLDMVSRYCRSITFDDCLEQYMQVTKRFND